MAHYRLKRTSPAILGWGSGIQTEDTEADQGVTVGGVQLQHPLKGSASPVKLAQLEEADAQAQANIWWGFRMVLQGFAVPTATHLPTFTSLHSFRGIFSRPLPRYLLITCAQLSHQITLSHTAHPFQLLSTRHLHHVGLSGGQKEGPQAQQGQRTVLPDTDAHKEMVTQSLYKASK